MIVDSMTLEEIAQELNSDYENAIRISRYRHDKYKSLVLKSRSFPVSRHYECTTPHRKNRFFVAFTAFKRGEWDHPLRHFYCIYSRLDGLYCAVVGLDNIRTYIYPPHFFARYRERIIKREDLSPEELIHFFMNRFWGFCGILDQAKDIEDVTGWEQLSGEGIIDFVGTCPDGVLFGSKHGNVILIKTIIPESMLYPDQQPFYERVYLQNWVEMKKVFPQYVIDYIVESEMDYYQPPEKATPESLEKLCEKYNRK